MKAFGYTRDQAVGRSLAGLLIPPRFHDVHARGMAHYLKTGECAILGQRIEVMALCADGSEFPAELTVTVIASKPAPIFTAFLRDITERKRATAALEERVRLALLTGDVAIALTRGDTLAAMLDLCSAALIEHLPIASARIWTVREGTRTLVQVGGAGEVDPTQACIAIGETPVGRVAATLRPHVANGTIADDPSFTQTEWVAFKGLTVFAGYPLLVSGRLLGAIALYGKQPLGDATLLALAALVDQIALGMDRKQLDDQFRQAQKMEAIGHLAGGIAHDFNNLVTVINGFADLLGDHIGGNPEARPLVEEIAKAGNRAAALTRQLLAFSRKQVLQPKVLDLNALIRDLSKMLPRLLGEDVELQLALGAIPPIHADPGQLEQVIVNLAVNARDAMPTGGTLTIETSEAILDGPYAELHAEVKPGAFVRIAVKDTGTGMDAKTLARVFEPFFTTKGPDRGTGLGLATVFGIVKQSDGHIDANSAIGAGTTFYVYLPAHRAAQPAPALREIRLPPLGGTETVLLVEDEAGVRRLTRHLLRLKGYRVIEAGDGEEAIQIAAQHPGPIDLVLTDVVMPRMSGRELVQRLHENRRGLKVLYMSGYTDDAVVRHGVFEECVDFLQKPFSPLVLTQRVRQALDGNVETPRSLSAASF